MPDSSPPARLAIALNAEDQTEILSDEVVALNERVLAGVDWRALEQAGEDAAEAWQRVVLVTATHLRRSRLLPETDRRRELRMGADLMAVAHSLAPEGTGEDPRRRFAALYETPTGEDALGRALSETGLRVFEEGERGGDPEVIERSLILFEKAVRVAEPDGRHLAAFLSNLGMALVSKYTRTGDEETLNAAVTAYRRAVGSPAEESYRTAVLANLGVVLVHRFDLSGDEADLLEAIDVQRAAAADTAEDDPGRRLRQANLGGTLTTLFEQTGDEDALTEALETLHDVVGAMADDDPDRPTALSNSARALLRHFELTADTDALRAALGRVTELFQLTPENHPNLPARLGDLSAVWLRLFGRTGDLAALDSAAEALEAALALPHHRRASFLSNLGTVHQRRFDHTGEAESAQAAARAYEETIALTGQDEPAYAGYLSNLANTLTEGYRFLGHREALDRAVGLLRRAVHLTSKDDPGRCVYLANLGAALEARHQVGGDPADLDAALSAYAEAADVVSAPILGRARAAQRRGRLATAVSPAVALDGYRRAVGLLTLLAWQGLGRVDQERLLEEFSGTASEAAACAIAAGRVGEAVELLEQGRGVLLGQALDSQTGDDRLRLRHPDHAERLDRLHRILDRGYDEGPLRSPDTDAKDEPSRQADRAVRFADHARERERLLSEIRRLDGFAGFLRPPSLDVLRTAASGGPVVIVNVSRFRCDALIVTVGAVRAVPLPDLTHAAVLRTARVHMRLVDELRRSSTLPAARRVALSSELRQILEWLWNAVAAPVMAALGLTSRETGWPRLWWCPTGPLGLLPLHAAQRYDHERMEDTGVADRVVSSYTPTLRALISARTARAPAKPGRLLAVCLPRPPGQPPLPYAEAEIEAVVAGREATVLRDEDATVDAMTRAMARHSRFHFVGHSAQNPRDPGQAALFLYDGALSMRTISRLRVRDAELAFLSSCESGLGGTILTDEAVHLAGALQFVGFRGVIATLWAIRDHFGVDIAQQTYQRTDDARNAAAVLHRVLSTLRKTESPLVWAAYCHTGA